MPTPFVAVPSWELEAGAASQVVEQPDPVPPRPASHVVESEPDATPDASRASSGPAAGGRHRPAAGVAAHELDALGPLAEFATDGPVTDLFLNGEAGLWVDRGGGAERDPRWTATEAEVRALAVRLIARGGRHVDEATPAVDVRLARGIRVHAVLPPLSSSGTLLSIRIPRVAGFSLAALARAGMLDAEREQALRRAVLERKNLLVSGAGGTGKTTLLGALLAEAPHRERIVLLEDVAELRIDHPHVVALEARQANLEGSGRIALDVLLREALRMRPDRLVVGECRGPELRELLAALNTGHDGGAGTVHANSLDDVPSRLEALGSTAGMTPEAVARQAVSAFDLVVHLERVDGRRRVAQVGRFALDGGRLAVEPC